MKPRAAPGRRRSGIRLWALLFLVAVVGAVTGLASDPVWRARWFLLCDQPVRAWGTALEAPPGDRRDGVLAAAMTGALARGEDDDEERARAALSLSTVAPVPESALVELGKQAGDDRNDPTLREFCIRSLGLLARSQVGALEELLSLLARDATFGGAEAATTDVTFLRMSMVDALAQSCSLSQQGSQLASLDGLRRRLLLSALEANAARSSPPAGEELVQTLAELALEADSLEVRCVAARVLRRLGPRATAALPRFGAAIDSLELDVEALRQAHATLLTLIPGAGPVDPPVATCELLVTLEILASVRAIGADARGIAPAFLARVREERRPQFWVPPLVALYAAVEESEEATLITLRELTIEPAFMSTVAAALEILRLEPEDETAQGWAINAGISHWQWATYVGGLHSSARPRPFLGGTPPSRMLGLQAALKTVTDSRIWRPVDTEFPDAWGAMRLADLLGEEPRPVDFSILRQLLRLHRAGPMHREAIDRMRRLAARGAVSLEQILDINALAGSSSDDVWFVAAIAAAERFEGCGPVASSPLLPEPAAAKRADPLLLRWARETRISLAALAGDEQHPRAAELLVKGLRLEEGRATLLNVLMCLIELARVEGREIEGDVLVELAEPWLFDDDSEVRAVAGQVVFTLRPDHPELTRWCERWLEGALTDLGPHLERVVPIFAGRPAGKILAEALRRQQFDESYVRAGKQTPGVRVARALRVLEQRPNASPEDAWRPRW